jgi:hypothetical protein
METILEGCICAPLRACIMVMSQLSVRDGYRWFWWYGGKRMRREINIVRKLESPWVGPYIVTEVIPGGAYWLQDKKIGKMRATRGMQNKFDVSTHKRSTTTENSELWPSEPRTWGHRSGSLGQLDNMYNMSLFSTRGLRPSSHVKKCQNYWDHILTYLQE